MKTVLIVEDDLTIADLLQEALENDGYQVTGVARTVRDAIAKAERNPPDFAIIDVRLAQGELGTDVGAHLRRTSDTKIMYSTGNSNDFRLLQSCGDAVMTKPYSLNDVGKALKIIQQLAQPAEVPTTFPRNFRLLTPVAA